MSYIPGVKPVSTWLESDGLRGPLFEVLSPVWDAEPVAFDAYEKSGDDGPDPMAAPGEGLVLENGGDIPAGTSSTTTLAIGSSLQSSVEIADDRDWVAVELVAGQSYEFTLTGTGGTPLGDPLLNLHDAAGNLIATDDDGGSGLNSAMVYIAQETGTYYLNAGAYASGTGDYILTADTAPPPSPTDAIDWGTQVSGTTLTVYFAQEGEFFNGETALSDWTNAEKAAAMNAWGVFADVANIEFVETSDQASADFTLVKADMDPDTLGYFIPPGETNAGIGVFNETSSTWNFASLQPGGYAFLTLVHEFGHGLGLAHPHDSGGGSAVLQGVTDSFGDYGDWYLNQGVFTVMSYNDGWPRGPVRDHTALDYGWQGTLSPLDIAVIQEKYGARAGANSGDDVYFLNDTDGAGAMFEAIWDTGGTDTIMMAGTRQVTIDLRAATLEYGEGGGGFVSHVAGIIGGMTIANGVVIENATGGSNNDDITGNDVANILKGRDGHDDISGLGGDDTLRGGNGMDRLRGGDGNDFLDGEADADDLYGDAGQDTLHGSGGNDRLAGGDDNDMLYGDTGNDYLYGGAGDDYLSGGVETDHLYGGDGNDVLEGGADWDILEGGAGDDVLDGGDGEDRAIYSGSYLDYSVTVNGDGTTTIIDLRDGSPDGTDTLIGIETIYYQQVPVGVDLVGTVGDDRLTGSEAGDTLDGGDGNDVLFGLGGNDELLGGAGNDFLIGGDGNDWLRGGSGDDLIRGGADQDWIRGGEGADRIKAGDGTNDVEGEGGDDRIIGGIDNDSLDGGFGNDMIFGNAGDDYIIGDRGADLIYGQDGNDIIYAGRQWDFVLGGQGDDYIDGGLGNDRLHGGGGTDTIIGGEGDDVATGGGGQDRFTGGAGNDRFDGLGGLADTAVFSGNYADYQLQYFSGAGMVIVTDLRDGSPDGQDQLFTTELLEFADGTAAVNSGAFDFTPDAAAAEPLGTSKLWSLLNDDMESRLDSDGAGLRDGQSQAIDQAFFQSVLGKSPVMPDFVDATGFQSLGESGTSRPLASTDPLADLAIALAPVSVGADGLDVLDAEPGEAMPLALDPVDIW